MSQNPYNNLGGTGTQYGGGTNTGAGSDFIDPAPSRTSVLAITALVISVVGCLGCFLPGPGAFAAIIGGLAVFLIARSSGRITGLGIAITAIVLGLFQSVAWIAAAIGITQAFGQYDRTFVAPAGVFMSAVEKNDFKTARESLTKEANEAITDDDLRVFVTKYHDSFGAFTGVPTTALNTGLAFRDVGRTAQQKNKGRGPVIKPHGGVPEIPIPCYFTNGTTFVMLAVDPQAMSKSNPQTGEKQKFLNFGVVTLGGDEIWVLDPNKAEKLIQWGTPDDKSPPTGSDASKPAEKISPEPATKPARADSPNP